MPVYDPVEERMVVRVVYDGVAFAGKTTNLRQLCVLFASQKQNHVITPSELRGRTLFFDWLQITAGVACGIPLLSQVLSIPGQGALAPRRKHILATADVVVFVCESDPAGIEKAREGLAVYESLGRPIPIILQANKQDRRGALSGAEVARALGRPGAPVIEAIASDGVGVVDTFIQAVRAVVKELETRPDLAVDVRRAERADTLLSRLEAEGLDPEWAAEMYLEEAQAALLFGEAEEAVANDDELRAAAAAALLEITHPAPAFVTELAPISELGAPILPSPTVPTGFVWPAHTGRAILRALELPQRTDAGFDANGFLTHAVAGHVVQTSTRACFPDAEAARQALVRTARAFTQIEDLLVTDTVLVAQQTDEGRCWIWNVRPNLAPIESPAMYIAAIGAAIAASLRHGLSLQLTPNSFGVEHGRARYIGELAPEPPTVDGISAELARAARSASDPAVFYAALEIELQRRLTTDERARVELRVAP